MAEDDISERKMLVSKTKKTLTILFTIIFLIALRVGGNILLDKIGDIFPTSGVTGEHTSTDGQEPGRNGSSREDSAPQVAEGEFRDCYAYHTLDREERQLYNEMYTAIRDYRESVTLSGTRKSQMETAYYALLADHAELFWVKGYSYVERTLSGVTTALVFKPDYSLRKDQVDTYKKKIKKKAAEFLSGAKKSMSDYEKSKYIYETLVKRVRYDIGASHNQSIVSVFVGGATVCRGYAGAAQYLLRELGIQSVVLSGRANNGVKIESHAWNAVKLDGDWYHFDVTWGDPEFQSKKIKKNYVEYGYLNITDKEIKKTHSIDSHVKAPACKATKNNYFKKENLYIKKWNPERAGTMFRTAWRDGRKYCSVKFAGIRVYRKAVQYFFSDGHIFDYCNGMRTCTHMENPATGIITVHFR